MDNVWLNIPKSNLKAMNEGEYIQPASQSRAEWE